VKRTRSKPALEVLLVNWLYGLLKCSQYSLTIVYRYGSQHSWGVHEKRYFEPALYSLNTSLYLSDLITFCTDDSQFLKAKQSKRRKTGAFFRSSMPLIYIRINRVPKYTIYSYIILLLLPIPVNSALQSNMIS